MATAENALSNRDQIPVSLNKLRNETGDARSLALNLRVLTEAIDGQDAFHEALTELLAKLWKHKSPLVRGYVAQAYQKIGGEFGKHHLLMKRQDPHAYVQEKVENCLQTFRAQDAFLEGDFVSGFESATPAQQLIKAKEIAANPDSRMVAVLLNTAQYQGNSELGTQVKRQCLLALAKSLKGQESEHIPALSALLADSDHDARSVALICLGRISDDAGLALKSIVPSLVSPYKKVQSAAAIALSEGFRAEHDAFGPVLANIFSASKTPGFVKEALYGALLRAEVLTNETQKRLMPKVFEDILANKLGNTGPSLALLSRVYQPKMDPQRVIYEHILRFLEGPETKAQWLAARFLALFCPRENEIEQLEKSLKTLAYGPAIFVLDALKKSGGTRANSAVSRYAKAQVPACDYALQILKNWEPISP